MGTIAPAGTMRQLKVAVRPALPFGLTGRNVWVTLMVNLGRMR
jgi:hypothetical protein